MADTLAWPVSGLNILVISGISSWAEQQGGAAGLRGASATSVGLEGRCMAAGRQVSWVSRSRTLWPSMADLSCSALREDSVVASFSLMTLMARSDSSCSSPVAVSGGTTPLLFLGPGACRSRRKGRWGRRFAGQRKDESKEGS